MMDRATMAMSSWFHLGTSNKRKEKKNLAGWPRKILPGQVFFRRLSPVLEEPLDAKGHEFEQGLHDEDAGEHVVAVLQNLF